MVVDAILWVMLAAAIGLIVMGCVLTARPRQSLAFHNDSVEAKLDRAA